MKKYEDQMIIKQRRDKLKEKFQSIEDGMYVGERLLNFEIQTLDQNGLQMFLPDILSPMDDTLRNIKYPMEKRPKIIWSDSTASVTFNISFLEQKAEQGELSQIRDHLGNTILSVYPHYIFTDKGEIHCSGGICCWAEFLNPVIGGMLYNLLFVTRLEEQLLMGMFNCPADVGDEWKKVILMLIQTIRKGDEDERKH